MWTIQPVDANWLSHLFTIEQAINRMQEHPAEALNDIGAVGLERIARDIQTLLRMNTRLIVLVAHAQGELSEGQASRILGLDRVTFREIAQAATEWALHLADEKGADDEAERGPHGGGAGEPPPPGVSSPGASMETRPGVPPP